MAAFARVGQELSDQVRVGTTVIRMSSKEIKKHSKE